MLDSLPNLQIIALNKLVVHELHDNQRTPPLIEKLRASGKLKNPPIITPFQDNSGRYMVMDGANRITALEEMGFPHILAQVVEPDAPGLEMQSWNHVIWGMSTQDFIDNIEEIPDLSLQHLDSQEDALRQLWNHEILIYIQIPDETVLIATTPKKELTDKVDLLHQIMDTYKEKGFLDRTRIRNVSPVRKLYQDLTALLVYPPFIVPEVLEMCDKGILFPAGVTRFIVAPRALRVNYPLSEMESNKPIEEKNQTLQKWLQEKAKEKGLRFYLEPTVLYDE